MAPLALDSVGGAGDGDAAGGAVGLRWPPAVGRAALGAARRARWAQQPAALQREAGDPGVDGLAGSRLDDTGHVEPRDQAGEPVGAERAQVSLPVEDAPAGQAAHVGAVAVLAVGHRDEHVLASHPTELGAHGVEDRGREVLEHLAAQHGVDRARGEREVVALRLHPTDAHVAQRGGAALGRHQQLGASGAGGEVVQDPAVAGPDVDDAAGADREQVGDGGEALLLVVGEEDVALSPEVGLLVVVGLASGHGWVR